LGLRGGCLRRFPHPGQAKLSGAYRSVKFGNPGCDLDVHGYGDGGPPYPACSRCCLRTDRADRPVLLAGGRSRGCPAEFFTPERSLSGGNWAENVVTADFDGSRRADYAGGIGEASWK